MSIIKLLDGNGYIESGSITFDGKDILQCTDKEMYHIRGNEISVIFQEPMTSLNPVFTVERQIGETLQIHQNMTKKEARKRAVDLLADVKIPNPERVAKQYPFQLSGGMRQRVMIAMALACKPKLLIADEPTTALDVTIQAQILKLMNDLKAQMGTSILFITHDLGVIHEMADEVAVMYCGQIVEKAPAADHLPRRHLLPPLHRGPDDLDSPAEHPKGESWTRFPALCPTPCTCPRAANSAPGASTAPSAARRRSSPAGGGAGHVVRCFVWRKRR